MSYRLIDSNAIAIKYPEVNEMPCVFANLPDGMNGQFIDVRPEVLACGNGELVAQPEPTDINAKEAVYNLAEKIGIHQLFALTVELRGEPIQPEPAIPLSWIEKQIEWLKSLDNGFSTITATQISAMVKKWEGEQNATD